MIIASVLNSDESMPVVDDQSSPWTLIPSQSRANRDARFDLLAHYVNEWNVRTNTIRARRQTSIDVFESNKSESTASEVDQLTDDELLDSMYYGVMTIEESKIAAEGFEREMNRMQVWKDSTSVWTTEAESLFNEFRYLHKVFEWRSREVRALIDEMGAEFDKRHPELTDLQVEPSDLGETNCARLPPVL